MTTESRLLNSKELRELASKIQSLCEDPGGIGDHVIAQHAAVREALLPLFNERELLRAEVVKLTAERDEARRRLAVESAVDLKKDRP